MSRRVRTMTLAEIAEAVGGEVEGDSQILISGVAGLDDATPGTVLRVEHNRFLAAAEASEASALLVAPNVGPVQKPCIRVPNPKLAFARCLELLFPEPPPAAGIHATAVIDESAEISDGCSVGPYAVVGARVRLAPGVVLHAHSVVGDECEIGEQTVLYPQVTLYPRTRLGARVRIHSGAVIGADGYGYMWSGGKHLKIPQVGSVRIEDDVEIGANSTIDRATTGETVIGPGTKIDNLVQIGHNVRTGAHCLLIAQSGVAGSATLGNGVILAGKAGVKDHVVVGDGVIAGAQTGIWSDQPAGMKLSGHPARPHRESVRIEAALKELPALLRRVRELERRLAADATGEDEEQ